MTTERIHQHHRQRPSDMPNLGHRGDYRFEVFNHDYQQMPLPTVVARVFKSARWLGEDVFRRSVPLPNQIRLKA